MEWERRNPAFAGRHRRFPTFPPARRQLEDSSSMLICNLQFWSEETLQNANCKMQIAKCKLQNANCKMQIAKCKLQNANCKLIWTFSGHPRRGRCDANGFLAQPEFW